MATYIVLIDFTEQGIRNIKDTAKRADVLVESAKSAGVTVKEVYWTMGAYDGVLILEAQDDETTASFLLSLGSFGNVRTKTMRAFSRSEIEGIVAKAK